MTERRIWLAFHGDYGQRAPFAAFTTKELAASASDDVDELLLLDRRVRTTNHWVRWIEVRAGIARDLYPKRLERAWPEWVGDDWDQPISEANVSPQPGKVWVMVEGADERAVDERAMALVQEQGAVYQSGYAVGWGRGIGGDDWEHRSEVVVDARP